jgi:hypothetical protein
MLLNIYHSTLRAMATKTTTRCPRSQSRQRYKDTRCNCRSEVAQAVREISNTTCNSQSESSLFTLPGEIRNEIYKWVLAQENSKLNREFDRDQAFYRPDFTHFQFIDTALLRTCKRVYQETRHIVLNNVPLLRFWLGSVDRQPCMFSRPF